MINHSRQSSKTYDRLDISAIARVESGSKEMLELYDKTEIFYFLESETAFLGFQFLVRFLGIGKTNASVCRVPDA